MAATQQLSMPLVVTLALTLTCVVSMPTSEYLAARKALSDKDKSTVMGHKLQMNDDEQLVSDSMVKEKSALIEKSRIGRDTYFPAMSYFKSKPLMEKTNTYRIIQDMPKGGVLHLHDMAMTSLDWLISNITYRDNLYMCVDENTYLITFHFFKTAPANPGCEWKLVKIERAMAQNTTQFDLSLKNNMSLVATDPFVTYPTLTQVWNKFGSYFGQAFGLIFYKPVFKDYFQRGLKEFLNDNVQYIELRCLMSNLYDLEGNVWGTRDTFDLYHTALEEFKSEHPEFIGVKFILSGDRSKNPDAILKGVKDTIYLRQNHPDLMLGYDLVAQEDPYNTLQYYLKELLYPSQLSPPVDLPYYFHAAETDWQGTGTDNNLLDAILLNTTRIGHGYGLNKHPTLVKEIKKRGIAIEANPISNQLLGLYKDPRNHALIPLIADDFPIVVSSDDPPVWEAAPLSSDFYVAFMNMCGEDNCDLRFLKQLAINSFQYSGMTQQEKQAALKTWQKKWDAFIEKEATAIRSKNGNPIRRRRMSKILH